MYQKTRPTVTYPPKLSTGQAWQRESLRDRRVQRRRAPLPVGSYGGGRAPSLDRRARVYRAILDFAADHGGNTPTHRQIQQMADISSSSVVAYNIAALVDDGRLERKDGKICVVGCKWFAPDVTE